MIPSPLSQPPTKEGYDGAHPSTADAPRQAGQGSRLRPRQEDLQALNPARGAGQQREEVMNNTILSRRLFIAGAAGAAGAVAFGRTGYAAPVDLNVVDVFVQPVELVCHGSPRARDVANR